MKAYFSATEHPKIVGVAQGIETFAPDSFFWHKSQMSLFDLIEEKKPDAIFLNDNDTQDDHIKYAKHEFPHIKFVLFTEGDEVTEGFDAIYSLNNPKSPKFIPYLANPIALNGGNATDQYKCDFVLFSNRLDAENKGMLKWLSAIGNRYHFKIYGNNRLPIPYYLGRPQPEEYRNIIKSAKAVIMMDEEWFYSTVLNDRIPLVFDRTKDKPWKFDQYEEITALCDSVLKGTPEWMDELKKEAEGKTYIEFAKQMKEELGL